MNKRLILAFCLIVSNLSHAQDIFTFDNSKKYGEFLFKSGQFNLASKEYERLVYMKPTDDSLKLFLLKSYRLANQNPLALSRSKDLFPITTNMPYPIAIEYTKEIMVENRWKQAENFLDSSKNIPLGDKILIKTSNTIFNGNFKKANTDLKLLPTQNSLSQGYQSIIDRGLNLNLKSPILAGIMSAIVPGSGKAYSKNWKDGVISLLMTAGMVYQGYRGFHNHGINSAQGWIYGGLGLGFYLGNIYGGVQSTKNYNNKKLNVLKHEASDLFNTYY